MTILAYRTNEFKTFTNFNYPRRFCLSLVAHSKITIYNSAIVSEITQCDHKSTVFRGKNMVEESHRTLANSSSNMGQGNKIYTIF